MNEVGEFAGMDGRFWSKVNKTDTCWFWTASTVGKSTYRYGGFWYKGKTVRAHRFSYEETYGPIPKGMKVLHKCDNPLCVRPDHLFLGTDADNNLDRSLKGRHKNQYTNKSTCRRGHSWTEENTMRFNNGKAIVKRCRECRNEYRRK